MSTNHWGRLYRAWSRLSTPVRLPPEVVVGVRNAIAEHSEHVLLLGVTPDFADIGSNLTAVDRGDFIRNRWPGNTAMRRAVAGDWLRLPFAAGSFSGCIGDGVPIAVKHPEGATPLYRSIAGVLKPGGRFVSRVFLAPDAGESVSAVRKAALQGEICRFQALKFRLAMALVAERGDPNIPVRIIHDAFEASFADRGELAKITGWRRDEIDTIDVYRSSPEVYTFPTSRECLSVVPSAFSNARLVPAGTYELAERCPLLVMEKA